MNLEQIANAVRGRDAASIRRSLFEDGEVPSVRSGARTETELWDYKANVPTSADEWATIARHALAFHNNRGGVNPEEQPEGRVVDEEIPAREAAKLLGLKSSTVAG